MPIVADLHCHSIYSDGALTPKDLVAKAIVSGVKIFSLTDHDTVSGSILLRNEAIASGIQIIDGIELSVRWKKHDIHILGLNIDIESKDLLHLINQQIEARISRAQQISSILESTGINHVFKKACELAGHERVGRPHLAQVLINEGIVGDMAQAFKRYLGRGKIAYIPTEWLSIEESVKGINVSGGTAVIAHPLKYKLTRTKLNELIREFKMVGGQGIEVVSGDMTTQEISEMAGICEKYELYASTGSDFHSPEYSRIGLGRQPALPLNCKPVWEQWN